MKRLIIFLALATAACAKSPRTSPSSIVADDSKIRVCVFYDLHNIIWPKADAKALSDSVKDVTKHIGKRKHLVAVDTAEAADIVVTILSRWLFVPERDEFYTLRYGEEKEAGRRRGLERHIISYRITFGEFSHQSQVMGERWGQAAGELSKEVEQLAKRNRDQLLMLRQFRQ